MAISEHGLNSLIRLKLELEQILVDGYNLWLSSVRVEVKFNENELVVASAAY